MLRCRHADSPAWPFLDGEDCKTADDPQLARYTATVWESAAFDNTLPFTFNVI
jgi:hypothetical protein